MIYPKEANHMFRPRNILMEQITLFESDFFCVVYITLAVSQTVQQQPNRLIDQLHW